MKMNFEEKIRIFLKNLFNKNFTLHNRRMFIIIFVRWNIVVLDEVFHSKNDNFSLGKNIMHIW